jgi:hypothetical protein
MEERRDADDETPDFNQADRTLDALGYYGTWKLLDGLTDAASFLAGTGITPLGTRPSSGSWGSGATACQ